MKGFSFVGSFLGVSRIFLLGFLGFSVVKGRRAECDVFLLGGSCCLFFFWGGGEMNKLFRPKYLLLLF